MGEVSGLIRKRVTLLIKIGLNLLGKISILTETFPEQDKGQSGKMLLSFSTNEPLSFSH